jgi:hypothetical protein
LKVMSAIGRPPGMSPLRCFRGTTCAERLTGESSLMRLPARFEQGPSPALGDWRRLPLSKHPFETHDAETTRILGALGSVAAAWPIAARAQERKYRAGWQSDGFLLYDRASLPNGWECSPDRAADYAPLLSAIPRSSFTITFHSWQRTYHRLTHRVLPFYFSLDSHEHTVAEIAPRQIPLTAIRNQPSRGAAHHIQIGVEIAVPCAIVPRCDRASPARTSPGHSTEVRAVGHR